ncbi:MAG: DUF5916 domain-containing protein [Bacteroidota bacterium]
MKFFSTLLLAIAITAIGYAQNTSSSEEVKKYFTKKTNLPPEIDGLIEEAPWQAVEWSSGYVQRQPNDGAEPTYQTAMKVLYDDKYLYIGFRCFDDEPEKIVERMSRRDGFAGDWIEVNIDSYFDKRTAFSFTLSAAGVRGDEFISNDGSNWDESWNPIWNGKSNIDDQGWTAEMRIPLSQLRYGNKEEQVWGIQSTRRFFRNEERSSWQPVSQNAGAWVSKFGELHGLKGLKPQKQIEIQPYAVGQAASFEKVEGNPFADGSDYKLTAGVDGKIGVTSDFVLDFTINPDFGQVEADPSVVVLDGFQVFFREQRPFFVENRNIFDYSITSAEAGGAFNSDILFYSRRIGGSPHGYPSLQNGEYVDVPQNTSILGAAKFSGKTKKGFSLGILESVTAKEFATIDLGGEQREEIVEPLTNYFVGRAQQDFNEGNTYVGGILTSVNRNLKDTPLDWLHESAYSGGIDFRHRWGEKQWNISGRALFSNVNGTQAAILRTQQAFEHNFQRPDADHLSVDPDATSLTGNAGNLSAAKYGGNWKFQTGVTWRSPEFEINDIGFLRNADEINHYLWTGYNIVKQFSIFRRYRINYNHYSRWDYGGNHLYQAVNMNTHTTFNNFWSVGTGVTREMKDISNNFLRGGPAFRLNAGWFWWGYAETNYQKAVAFSLNWSKGDGEQDAIDHRQIGVGIRIQPIDAMSINIRPSFTHVRRVDQYVTTTSFQGEDRFIMGEIEQRTLSMTTRLNYNITPDLTLQFYGQPFISRGRYSNLKYVNDPQAELITERLTIFQNQEFSNDRYLLDENNDGVADYSINDPDFNFIQFRSNLVGRWEYVPGSELYLVWSQGTTAFGDPNAGLLTSLNDNLFSEKARNIFLVKWTYRFLL